MAKKKKYKNKKIIIAAIIVFLALLFSCWLYFNFMNNSSITAYDVMKLEQERYNKSGFIRYTKTNKEVEGAMSEAWHDNSSKMQKIIYYKGGIVERIDVDGMDNYWTVDFEKKIYKDAKLEFINEQERKWFISVIGNPDYDLTGAKKLPIKKIWLGSRIVYFIPVSPNKYLYYDVFNYSLVRIEFYEGEGKNRKLTYASNMKTQMIPGTKENLKEIFKKPTAPKEFKVCESTFKNLKGRHYVLICDNCFAATSNEEATANCQNQ